MSLLENQEIKTLSQTLKAGMLDYIEPGDTSYTAKDVEMCMDIVHTFLTKMESTQNKEKGMELAKNTVLALNELNENCEEELIETDQREDLAEIIVLAGSLKGYNDREDDITEEWREW